MVDALRRVRGMVTVDGTVVDVHPTASASAIEVETEVTGYIDACDAPLRHAAADAAVAAAVRDGLYAIEQAVEFTFYTYGATIDELREYIRDSWRDARIDEATVGRTRDALRRFPGSRPRSRERVVVTSLRPRRGAGNGV